MRNIITCGEIAARLWEQINAQDAANRGLRGGRSAWDRGLIDYARQLLDGGIMQDRGRGDAPAPDHITRQLAAWLMGGADSWREYSYGGCALIYDGDIARKLCAPWELRRTRDGARRPNSRETWLDVQARALGQAAAWIGHNWRVAYNALAADSPND